MFLQERKPLIWERLRSTERFSFVNTSKIVHVVMDEVINLERVRSSQWYHELTQTDTGIQRIKLWSLQTGHLEADDLLISADVDEVMSASALQALKWCDTHQVRVVFVCGGGGVCGCVYYPQYPHCVSGCVVWSSLDAIRKSRQSLQERVSRPRQTSHLQPAHHIQVGRPGQTQHDWQEAPV